MMPDFPELIKEMNTKKESVKHFDKQIMYYYKSLKFCNPKSLVDSQKSRNKRSNTRVLLMNFS